MKLHLAGSSHDMRDVAVESGVPWVMASYFYTKDAPTSGSGQGWVAEEYQDHPNCKGVVYDSGAFTYIKGESTAHSGDNYSAEDVDWYEYAEAYGNYIAKHNVERYMELDLDGPMGYDFAQEMYELLLDIVGYPPIPVWHRTRGLKVFREDCKKHDRVAMGGFPWNEIHPTEYKYLPKFIKTAHQHNARIHALGWQPKVEQMERYPFDSTDSTNWIFDSFKNWRRFDGRKLEYIRHEKKVTKEMYKHNLREWVKLSRHMDGRNEVQFSPQW